MQRPRTVLVPLAASCLVASFDRRVRIAHEGAVPLVLVVAGAEVARWGHDEAATGQELVCAPSGDWRPPKLLAVQAALTGGLLISQGDVGCDLLTIL